MKTRNASISIMLFCALLFVFVAVMWLASPDRAGPVQAALPAADQAAGDASRLPDSPTSPGPVLRVTILPSDDWPDWGATITYTIVLSNTGDAPASAAVMTNALPAGLTYVSGTLHATSGAAEYQATARTIRWQGDLALNTPAIVTYAAQLFTQEYIYNTAVLTHPQAAQAAGATSSPADEWGAPEIVDAAHDFGATLGAYRHIAVDSQGRPRVAYAGDRGLYYATFAGGAAQAPDSAAWSNVRVPITPTMLSWASLVLDAQDRARIAFYDSAGRIWLAREISPTANLWTLETVAQPAGWSNRLRLDMQRGSDDRLHLVYNYNNELYYTVYSATAWLSPTLVVTSGACSLQTPFPNGAGFSLALDQNDTPHVACARHKTSWPYEYELRLYTAAPTAPWTNYERVDFTSDSAQRQFYPSLAYAGNTPHISFLRYNRGLYHATKDGAWTVTAVDPRNDANDRPIVSALAIRGGQIAIAYAWYAMPGSVPYTETVRLATRPLAGTTLRAEPFGDTQDRPQGGAWTTESVDSMADTGTNRWGQPTLALDGNGRAHVAYYYLTDAVLRHAAQTGSFTYYTVDEGRGMGKSMALDVGSDGSIHVAYLSNGVRHAVSLSGATTWTRTLVVPGIGQVDALVDIALDAANTPHIVYQDMGQSLYHAVLSSGVWITRLIEAASMFVYPSLDADAAGTANVAYLTPDGANLAVRHAAFAAGAWTSELLGNAGPAAGQFQNAPQLAAQGGKVYVLYADCTAFQPGGDHPITLTLKTQAGGAWSTQALHTFAGQCVPWRLDYRLLGDSSGRLAAVALIVNPDGIEELTFWPATATTSVVHTPAVARSAAAAGLAPLGVGYGVVYQTRGNGLERLYVSKGQKVATYQDRNGATSKPVNLAQTLDAYAYLKALACYGQTAAALEYSSNQNALAVERTIPRPAPPTTWANATKSAVPAAVYAYEQITYTIRLEWRGNESAAISVKDSLFLEPVQYVPGSLGWGAYIADCQYNAGRLEITCSGAFPASDTPLSTQVTYAVTPTCDIYKETSPYVNTALVNIGPYQFTPSARTAIEAPFELRASTPRFIPRQYFAPIHQALLYTVPKGDEPESLKNCPLNVYTKLKVGSASYNPQPMRNDGQNPDFHAGDWHYSQWTDLIETDPHIYDLYVAAAGEPFAKALLADTLSIGFTYPPAGDPLLVVLTDFQAMFNEWGYIAQHYPADKQNAHIKDQNGNRILDYYDAVERIRQYADNEGGVVIDVARDAYDEATRNAGFYSTFANRLAMGNQIDSMIARLPRTVKNVAIIGNDAVVPYARLGVAAGAYPEVRPAYELLHIPYAVTGMDRQARDLSELGTWLSDTPYGTWTTARPNTPRLQVGVGRVFRDLPLDLMGLMDRMEQPLYVGRDSRAWVLNSRQLDETGESFQATHYNYSQEAESGILPTLRRYLRRVTKLAFHPAQSSASYPSGVYWLDGDLLLQPANTRWNAADTETVKNNGNLLVFAGPGGERGMQTGDLYPLVNRPVLADGQFGLALAAGNHAGLLPAGRDAEEWRGAWFGNAALDANAVLLAPTARAIRTYNLVAGFITDIGYPHMYARFLDNLFYDWHQILGQAQVDAHNHYAGTAGASRWGVTAFNSQALYTMLLNGLPTQRLQRGAGAQVAVTQVADRSVAALTSAAGQSATHTLNRSVALTHFEPITDTVGRVAFAIPHNGFMDGEPYGPLLPVVLHSYILPAAATDIAVALTDQQSHNRGPVTPMPLTPVDEAGQPLTGVITLTNPYPGQILSYDVYTDANRLYLNVFLVAQQYNPETRQATFYHRLDYRIDYTAPDTYTIASIVVNNGAAANVDQAALPITVTLNAGQPFSGTLYWAIQDQAGRLFDANQALLDLAAGVYQIGLASDTQGWDPGPKQFIVFLAADTGAGEEVAVAAGHALFTVAGRSLALATDKMAYGASAATASLAATVRNETGAPVAGQAANLATRLDGAAQALAWQGNGVYTAALNLGGIVAGQHFISVTLGGDVAEDAFIVDRQPPTSTLTGPAIVAESTFTVTLAGGDDLSGVVAYAVQYRVGAGGAWTDWLTRTVSSPADLALTFGPTQPVALQPGQTVHFRTRAVDVAGNWEAEHVAPDLQVKYVAPENRIYLPLVQR